MLDLGFIKKVIVHISRSGCSIKNFFFYLSVQRESLADVARKLFLLIVIIRLFKFVEP
jgi:hypothetical protein